MAIDALVDDIEALEEEVADLRTPSPRPDTPTPIPFHPTKEAPAPPAETRPTPHVNLSQPAPTPTWATVARKRNRRTKAIPTKPAPPAAKPDTAKPVPQKKGPTARERQLFVKKEPGALPGTLLELRDEINRALAGTYVQTVSVKGDTITLTTMETTKATYLNSRVSSFLHLIPSTISIHLDTPMTQLLVHGIPTSQTLTTIATELTTFNPGLALTSQPRWLTSETVRANKTASTVVITITGPKAPEFVGKRLAAFSSTHRTERRLRFNPYTQCSVCHGFGHHSNKCTAPASCRWCALPHTTGEHACPTATCRLRGRPCNHTILRCVNCNGPHGSHHLLCPARPEEAPATREVEEEMADT